jgi:hypothetical protein
MNGVDRSVAEHGVGGWAHYPNTVNQTGSAHDLKNIRAYMKNKWGWGGVYAYPMSYVSVEPV